MKQKKRQCHNQKINLLILCLTVIMVLLVSVIVINIVSGRTEESSPSQNNAAKLNKSDNEPLLFLGDTNAENEIIFVFDYSCPYCRDWIIEVFPEIEKNWIETSKAKFRTQSMVFLNETSLILSKFDYNIKEHYPDKYFDWFFDVIKNQEHFLPLDEHSIFDFVNTPLDENKINQEPRQDVINLTRIYTRTYDISVVPTVIVNGIKVENPFDINEIEKLLK